MDPVKRFKKRPDGTGEIFHTTKTGMSNAVATDVTLMVLTAEEVAAIQGDFGAKAKAVKKAKAKRKARK